MPLVGIADTAVMGQLNDPALIGGVALGSTIFAMLFWAFGFLRMGTTGLTAQAAGAGDHAEIAANLYRALRHCGGGRRVVFALSCARDPLHPQADGRQRGSAVGDSGLFRRANLERACDARELRAFRLASSAWRGRILHLRSSFFLNFSNIALAVLLVLGAGKGAKGAAMAASCAEYAAFFAGLFVARRLLEPHRGARSPCSRLRAFRSFSP